MSRKYLNQLTLFIFSLLISTAIAAADFMSASPEELGLSAERLERLDSVMKSYVDKGQLAGQRILILRQGKIAYSATNGMQDLDKGIAMSDDTIFRIASQTKAIVSTGIMILHERGDLDISQPLSRYIPEWEEMEVAVEDEDGGYTLEPARRRITLRNLLTHTGGMSYGSGPAQSAWQEAGFQGWYFANKSEPILASIRRMASLPLDEHPGERWIYGYNTDILGAVIEAVSGESLQQFLQEEIFDPLQMDSTYFYLPRSEFGRLATVYRPSASGGIEASPDPDTMAGQGLYRIGDGPNMSFSGGAGLLSTASDYASFLQMTLNGGELNGVRLLSPKTVELMTTNHLADIPFRPGQGFGLGFSIVEDLGARGSMGSEGEYGWGGAYHSTYWVDPEEELVVVYMTQILPATGLDDSAKLRTGIYQAIIE